MLADDPDIGGSGCVLESMIISELSFLIISASGVVTEDGLVRGGKSSSAKTNGGTWTWADLGTDKPGGLRG